MEGGKAGFAPATSRFTGGNLYSSSFSGKFWTKMFKRSNYWATYHMRILDFRFVVARQDLLAKRVRQDIPATHRLKTINLILRPRRVSLWKRIFFCCSIQLSYSPH